ncbi:hypothetical protein [Mesorhizobium sp. CAU 1732]|uniref:hypothetical protein n=1 Tax=Mesorhizobium sp. CAU 1732 TaxID=3140358 RepID=UPI003260739E
MGMIVSGIAVAIAIGIGAGYFLVNSQQQKSVWQAYSTNSTRVGDPGHNLVGQNWNGEPRAGEGADSAS